MRMTYDMRAFHRAPENRRAQPEIFGKEEKQYRDACGLPFGKPLQRGFCFDERRGKNGYPDLREGGGCPLKIAQTAASLLRDLREKD